MPGTRCAQSLEISEFPGFRTNTEDLLSTGPAVQVARITYHLNRAMENGLTEEQAGEVVTHLAFYAGWPNAFSALPVVRDVFEKRAK